MKKMLVSFLIITLVLLFAVTIVNATTQDELIEYITKPRSINGEPITVLSSYKTRIERYFSSHELTEEQCTKIKAKVDQAIAIFESEGVTNPANLSEGAKKNLLSIGQEAASIADLSLTYDSGAISIYDKDGTMLDSILVDNSKLVQAGGTNYMALALITVAVFAVATFIFSRDGKKN